MLGSSRVSRNRRLPLEALSVQAPWFIVRLGVHFVNYIITQIRTEIMNANEKAVAAVLADYEDALNQSDTEAVMKLYAPDGVFMPQHFPSSVGADAVRNAYDGVFEAITLKVKFVVAEVHQIAPDWAIARTNSAVTAAAKATRGR